MQNRLRALVLDDERPARNYLVEDYRADASGWPLHGTPSSSE